MQQLQLGDYKGSRDTLQAALGQDYAPLTGAMQMAGGMAQQGLSGVSARGLRRQMAEDNLSTQMGVAQMNAYNAQGVEERKDADTAEGNQGREAAMLDWAGNVLQSYAPDSPEYKQAKRTIDMIVGRKKGGTAHDTSYLDYVEEYGINDPFSQGTLGSLAAQYQGGERIPATKQKPKAKQRSGVDSEFDD
jgi:hypothetical protein